MARHLEGSGICVFPAAFCAHYYLTSKQAKVQRHLHSSRLRHHVTTESTRHSVGLLIERWNVKSLLQTLHGGFNLCRQSLSEILQDSSVDSGVCRLDFNIQWCNREQYAAACEGVLCVCVLWPSSSGFATAADVTLKTASVSRTSHRSHALISFFTLSLLSSLWINSSTASGEDVQKIWWGFELN